MQNVVVKMVNATSMISIWNAPLQAHVLRMWLAANELLENDWFLKELINLY